MKEEQREYINKLLNLGLYESIEFKKHNDLELFFFFLRYDGKEDFYCVDCGIENTSFEAYSLIDRDINTLYDLRQFNRIYEFLYSNFHHKRFKCSRSGDHKILFSYYINDMKIYKVAQYPSIKDFTSYNLNKYRKILRKDNYSEFKTAVGLFSHGVGIGSLIYLRRIIESLVKEALDQRVEKDESFDIEKFSNENRKVVEKVKKLKGYLPDFFVDNKEIYSILSKGIHELSEEKCKEYFPILRCSIEMILDEKIAEREREEKKKKLSKSIQKIHQEEKKK